MCHIYWATWHLDIGQTLFILGVSVKVILKEINFRIYRLSKADFPSWVAWTSYNLLKTWKEQKAEYEGTPAWTTSLVIIARSAMSLLLEQG